MHHILGDITNAALSLGIDIGVALLQFFSGTGKVSRI